MNEMEDITRIEQLEYMSKFYKNYIEHLENKLKNVEKELEKEKIKIKKI